MVISEDDLTVALDVLQDEPEDRELVLWAVMVWECALLRVRRSPKEIRHLLSYSDSRSGMRPKSRSAPGSWPKTVSLSRAGRSPASYSASSSWTWWGSYSI